jgi:hypothetical protein
VDASVSYHDRFRDPLDGIPHKERGGKPMKSVTFLIVCLVALLGFAGAAVAGDHPGHGSKDVTVSGSITCGKCTLKKADLKECQDVLVVADAKGAKTEYWLVKNDVLEKFGHSCSGEKAAMVSGSVMEKDGKMWLTATKMEAPKKG